MQQPTPASQLLFNRLDRWLIGIALVMVGGLVLLSIGGWLILNVAAWRSAWSPPVVEMAEVYAVSPAGQDAAAFDHAALDTLLKKHVDAHGWVDYAALQQDAAALDAYIASLADAPFELLSRDGKLALLINAYNACTLRLILDYYPLESIRDITEPNRWHAERWALAGETLSLNLLEHEWIRPKFVEPRIHFALVCAAVSCPKLRNEAYTAERLDEQLSDQVIYSHEHDRWMKVQWPGGSQDPGEAPVIYFTRLYQWYADDFQQDMGTQGSILAGGPILAWVAERSPRYQQLSAGESKPTMRWLSYNWSLNDVKNRPK